MNAELKTEMDAKLRPDLTHGEFKLALQRDDLRLALERIDITMSSPLPEGNMAKLYEDLRIRLLVVRDELNFMLRSGEHLAHFEGDKEALFRGYKPPAD